MNDFFGLEAVWPPDGTRPPKHDHDIVFVHGLQKGSLSDWTGEDGKFWPVDRLGFDLGTARIFAYGYDQQKLSIRSDGLYEGGIIFDHSTLLNSELEAARSADKAEVPLTFVGHGTGGIVIQSALCYARSPLYQHHSIFRKTRHVVFLDTPRQSLTQSVWDLVAQGSPSKDSATRRLLWSTVVSSVRDNFGKLADRWNITSAYRKLDKFSSGSPYEDMIPYYSDIRHETVFVLEKFEDKTIPDLVAQGDHYEQLLSRIRAGRVCTTDAEQHIQRLRLWLGAPSETLNDIIHQRSLQRYHPNTGRWLFEDPTFRDWARLEGDVSFIWLTGPDGCGKSILASQAIERIASSNLQCATPRLMLTLDKPQSEYELTALLASQLLRYVLDNAGGIDIESLFLLEQSYDKLAWIQTLIRLLISQCAAVFFFVDGIDDIPADQEDEEVSLDEETASNNIPRATKQNIDKKMKVGRAQRHVYSTLALLAALVSGSASEGIPVRLWCSSARTEWVQRWLKEFDAVELHAEQALVAKDIGHYLEHQIGKMQLRSWVPEKSNFVDRIGANFLLARWALEYSKKRGSSMTDYESIEFPAIACDGLQAFHRARLAEIQREDFADGNNLASKVLSILAFARRPLKFSELQEALAILLSPFEDIQGLGFGTHDMTIEMVNQGFQKVEDVIECCFPFLEVARYGDAVSQDVWIRFSHPSTLRLLVVSHDMTKLGIGPKLMATVCLKYLSQRRYSYVHSGLESPQDNNHSFLPYAAKHWHRHLNGSGEFLLRETKSFMRSFQFLSAIQAQSLFVDEHFPKSEEFQEDGSFPRHSVRLPLCLEADPEGLRLVEDYLSFVQDWTEFLSLGITTASTRGQIQRCFWGSLPQNSFLRNLGMSTESQQSYLLEAENAVQERRYLHQCSSSDGRRLAVWRLDKAGTNADMITLVRTSWYIDGERPPFCYGLDETLTTSRKQVHWDMYHNGIPQKTPLVPELNNLVWCTVMKEVVFGLEVRVGIQRFIRQKGGIWTAVPMADGYKVYWEDIISRGDHIVRSRRNVVVPQTERPSESPAKHRVTEVEDDPSDSFSSSDGDENNRPIRPVRSDFQKKTKSGKLPQKRPKRIGKSSSDEDVEPSASESESDEYLAYENFEDIVSSAEEFCTQSVRDDEGSDDDSSSESNSDSSTDLGPESDDVENRSSASRGAHAGPTCVDSTSAKQITKEDVSSSEDDDLSIADDATTSSTSSDSTSDSGSHADDEVLSLDSELPAESRINFLRWPALSNCDMCGTKLIKKRWQSQSRTYLYRCLSCVDQGSWDICEACFRKGRWCRNRSHPLHEGAYSFQTRKSVHVQVIFSSDVSPMANIIVERRIPGQENSRGLVSRFTRRLSSMLHDSSPVIHPKFPLLVFPLDGRELLFMNMEDSTYITYDIPYDPAETAETGAGTCLPLSVGLHFSSCGKYLRVLRFSARNESALFNPIKLFVVFLTVALNLENPCSGRPRTLAPCCGIELGSWPALVHQVPFTTTWMDTDLYIAVTGRAPAPILRVVRFPIRTGTQDDNSEGDVYTLSEDVTLPSSALLRPVHFFPATKNGAARIVLGCVHGPLTKPPVVVYLDHGNTRQWVPTKSLFMSSQTTHEHRKDTSIEIPDLYDDSNAITSHDAKKQATTGDVARPIVLSIRRAFHEWVRTRFQNVDMYCPSCFQLGLTLCGIALPSNDEYLSFGMDKQKQGDVVKDSRAQYNWQVTIRELNRALRNGCQFCSFVVARLFRGFHLNMNGVFLGNGGPRCCAKGPPPKRKPKGPNDITLISPCEVPEEARLIRFVCKPMKRDSQARSFSKIIIEAANLANQETDEAQESSEPLVYSVKEGSGEDGSPNILTAFDPRRMDNKFVMELYSLPNDMVHEWIPTSPITTDRGGDENIEVIKGWLNECRTKHIFCWRRNHINRPMDEALLPTRLLKITDNKGVCLVETQCSQLGQYTILSYCWGPDPKANTQTTRAKLNTRLTLGIPQKDLPAVVRDAVCITSKLSIKYIWVDALCIVQDDPDDMNRELGHMSGYYRNAYLTLAASTSACNKGFLGTVGRCKTHTDFPVPRDLVPLNVFCFSARLKKCGSGTVYAREENPYQLAAEPINQRAWTLQEQLLSPRMLFFGGRVIWFCNAATRCDGGVEDWSFDENASDRLTRDFQIELIRGEHEKSWNTNSAKTPSMDLEVRKNGKDDQDPYLLNLWHRIVSDYSGRKLSRSEDKLPAISAVAAEFALLCGSEYLAGLWRSNLARDLLWSTPETVPTRSKTWRSPSWSWASVDGAIRFDRLPPSDAVQLAIIERAEVEPLTPELPFGRLQDASGVLEITAPSFVFDSDNDGEKRGKISDAISKGYSMQDGQDERSLLLETLRLLARDTEREEQDISRQGGLWIPRIQRKKKYEVDEKALVLILFCKRDSKNSSGEDKGAAGGQKGEFWKFWGLILEPVLKSGETKAYQRVLAFADVFVELEGRDIPGFQKECQRTVRII